jgi:hypothetical protein
MAPSVAGVTAIRRHGSWFSCLVIRAFIFVLYHSFEDAGSTDS